MSPKNVFYAQSGGVTAVINASACGVIQAVNKEPSLGKVYAGKNGILGALHEQLIDTSLYSDEDIAALKHTPSGAFGSCRYKLKPFDQDPSEYIRLVEVFKAHNIGYFFYNGGGDSADTCLKVSQISRQLNYPIQAIHIPKTVDNDLPLTDCSPGFGSVAKYTAVSIKEAGLDVAAMGATSTKVFIMEVMGRHAGWIAAAGGLASQQVNEPPHIILFPEIEFDQTLFLNKVKACVADHGYCVIIVSEGIKDTSGQFLADAGNLDAFGHKQLGGVAPSLAQTIKEQLNLKYHWSVPDYHQRAARHIASKTDVEHAYAVGQAAVSMAIEGQNAVMAAIIRGPGKTYTWSVESVPLTQVANVEKKMPRDFISEDGFHITDKARDYLQPLILGEDYPPYHNGLPQYAQLKHILTPKKLGDFNPE